MASKLQMIERTIPHRILKGSMYCNAIFSFYDTTFGTQILKKEVKENKNRELRQVRVSKNYREFREWNMLNNLKIDL